MALPFQKKKSEAPVVPLVPPWHPNFRNVNKLPDIKVVRTSFFVNGIAGLVVLVALTVFLFQEYKLRSLRIQDEEAETQILRTKRSSELAVISFKKFQAEETKVLEADTFVKSKPVLSDLIVHLAKTLPKNMAIDTLELREAGVSLRITVRGTPETQGDRGQAYLEQLRADKELAVTFEDFGTTSVVRNPTTNRVSLDIFGKIKTAPVAVKKP